MDIKEFRQRVRELISLSKSTNSDDFMKKVRPQYEMLQKSASELRM